MNPLRRGRHRRERSGAAADSSSPSQTHPKAGRRRLPFGPVARRRPSPTPADKCPLPSGSAVRRAPGGRGRRSASNLRKPLTISGGRRRRGPQSCGGPTAQPTPSVIAVRPGPPQRASRGRSSPQTRQARAVRPLDPRPSPDRGAHRRLDFHPQPRRSPLRPPLRLHGPNPTLRRLVPEPAGRVDLSALMPAYRTAPLYQASG